ncbi:hypothetical protein OUZ56_020035 [Daphnia magna]|uniref:Uncharacterized protein n=1 Tax=Daphnia magna TaxID=35525 RepID=A0ABQ9ZE32_9CRUS|nr:hypothetical protein OUZ56_020035 [Daphnia magna]
MISLEGEEATHKSELTVNRSRKNLSETFHPLPASLSHAPGLNMHCPLRLSNLVLIHSTCAAWGSNPLSLAHVANALPLSYNCHEIYCSYTLLYDS